jgi:hypothetical protein
LHAKLSQAKQKLTRITPIHAQRRYLQAVWSRYKSSLSHPIKCNWKSSGERYRALVYIKTAPEVAAQTARNRFISWCNLILGGGAIRSNQE